MLQNIIHLLKVIIIMIDILSLIDWKHLKILIINILNIDIISNYYIRLTIDIYLI